MQHFFAYHGPENETPFDFTGGYGFAQEKKRDKIQIGDRVFVIQKLDGWQYFELCGLFEVRRHYHSGNNEGRQYRVALEPVKTLQPFLRLDEDDLSARLPMKTEGNSNWTNFKRHFCQQGGTFQSSLSQEVVDILLSLLGETVSKATTDFCNADELSDESLETLPEGARKQVSVNAYERSTEARRRCLIKWKHHCAVCNFHFEQFYGSIGKEYIHVHHLKPLNSIGQEYQINPEEDLRPVCPNCHAMLHQTNPPLSEELEAKIKLYGSWLGYPGKRK